MWSELILALVLYVNGGIVLPLFMWVHIEAQKTIKQINFSPKF